MPSLIKGTLSIFIIVPLTTYYLDPVDFGIAAIIAMITGLIMPLSSTGVTWVLSAHYYKETDTGRKELLFNILFLDVLLKAFWIILFLMTAERVLPLIVKDYEPRLIFYFQLSLLGVMLNGIWPSISYAIVLKKRGRAHAFIEIGQYLAGMVTTIVCMMLLKLSTITLFIAPLATGLFSFAAGLWYMRDDIRPRLNIAWLKEIVKVGMPTIPVNFFATISKTLDRFFIQKWINLSQLGIFSHSRSYEQIFTMGTKAFSRTFVPEALQVFAGDAAPGKLAEILRIWYGILSIAGLFVTLFSYEIIDVLTHGKFIAAAPLVPVWFMLLLSYALGMPYSQYLVCNKKTKFLVYSGIILGLISVCISAVLIFKFGIMGAVAAALLSNFLIQISRRIYARKLGCERIAEKEFFIALAVLLAAYFINMLVPLGFIEKSAAFIVISLFIAYFCGLLTYIKNNSQKVLDYIVLWKTSI